MFDISWSEFLLIGIVALIVIGPKELPGVLRTLGQWTRKVRGMAAEFQNQFQEAMREADMADLKKSVDELTHDIKHYDPLKDVRSDVEQAGKDIERSITAEPQPKVEAPETPVALEAPAQADAASTDAAPADAVPAVPVERAELAPAETGTAKESAPEGAAGNNSAGRAP